MNKLVKIFLVVLGIVCTLLLIGNMYFQMKIISINESILNKMPPTVEEMRNANQDERKKLALKKPMISADIDGKVEISNTPLEVEISNTPIDVEINR